MTGHLWQQKGVKAPTFCTACDNLIWGFKKSALSCGICKQVVHSKCQECVTVRPCIQMRNSSEPTIKHNLSFRHTNSQSISFSTDGKTDRRMNLKDFNTKMKTCKLPPFPVQTIADQTPLEAIFDWYPDSMDLEDGVDKERKKLFITFYDTDTTLATAVYQSFYNQSQVKVTDNTIPVHVESIYPSIHENQKKPPKKKKLIESKHTSDTEEELEAPKSSKTSRKRNILTTLVTGKKDREKNTSQEFVQPQLLTEGSSNSLNCIVVPCTVYGELAIPNSPQTTVYLDTLFESTFVLELQAAVQRQYIGEMKANECIILETENSKIPYVCCVAQPHDKDYLDTYSLLWSVLESIWRYNTHTSNPERRITSILCPIFQNANLIPVDTANRMYVAYRSFLLSINCSNEKTMLMKEKERRLRLTFNPTSYASVQKAFFLVLLLKEDIVKRNFICAKEFSMLIELVKLDDTELKNGITCFPVETLGALRESAARAIAHYTFPEQRYRYFRKEVLSNGCLKILLDFVFQEKVQVHRELSLTDVQIHSQIAQGGSGTVHKGSYKGIPVAVKTFQNFVTQESRVEFFRELGICSMLQHENLITCYGAHTKVSHKEEERFIVLALMERGCLYNILSTEKQLSKETRLRMALDCAKGMAYLHEQGIVHRDLKSLNLMVTEDWGVQVIDFGTSRVVDTFEMTNNLGSVFWMAPEIFQGGHYDNSVDVYAFGIVLWELITMEKPYANVKGWDVPKMVEKGDRPPVPMNGAWDDWVIKLMKACWHQKPAKRPTFAQIVRIMKSYLSSRARKSRSIEHTDTTSPASLRARSKSPTKRLRTGESEDSAAIRMQRKTVRKSSMASVLDEKYFRTYDVSPQGSAIKLPTPRKKKRRKSGCVTATTTLSDNGRKRSNSATAK